MIRRIASIDVGSNAIRFFAVEMDGDSLSRVLVEERFPVRFGHGVFSAGRISAEAASEAIAGLEHAAVKMKDLGVEKYRAVATAAIRESPNRREFVRSVRRRTGISVEIITGSEEIRLVHAAVKRRFLMGADQWVMVELGGGSVEVALATSARILWTETHAMGAVRLLELFAPGGKETRDYPELLSEYVATMRLPQRVRETKVRGFLATGGNIEALARIAARGAGEPDVQRVSVSALRDVARKLARMDVQDRARTYGLRPDRADVVVPAAVVFGWLAEQFGAAEIIVPGGGIREGIAFDLAEKLGVRRPPSEESTVEDAAAIGRKYSFDEAHSVHVARLAGQLFDQLSATHGLSSRDRRLLTAAAVLHDIGDFVALKGHHKHSLYLISRTELNGFSPSEMFLVANIARYHRKGGPSMRHPEFALLSSVDRERVRRLAAILRIADALDKEHREKIQRIEVRQDEGRIEILAGRDGDLLLERWALEKKGDIFRRVFGAKVTLVPREAERHA
ncbi:MAG TPA: Ppx/GppA phosphatase family protein [Spirochaetia bacterium]|nr:Ppx/GppA phosphatase family protein [Spirochaetia bacterium]